MDVWNKIVHCIVRFELLLQNEKWTMRRRILHYAWECSGSDQQDLGRVGLLLHLRLTNFFNGVPVREGSLHNENILDVNSNK